MTMVVVSDMFYFHPEIWGRWTHFGDHIFSKGLGTQPPTRWWLVFPFKKGVSFWKVPRFGFWVYIFLIIHRHIFTYIYIYLYKYIFIHWCLHSINIYIYTNTHIYIFTCIHNYMHLFKYTYLYPYWFSLKNIPIPKGTKFVQIAGASKKALQRAAGSAPFSEQLNLELRETLRHLERKHHRDLERWTERCPPNFI